MKTFCSVAEISIFSFLGLVGLFDVTVHGASFTIEDVRQSATARISPKSRADLEEERQKIKAQADRIPIDRAIREAKLRMGRQLVARDPALRERYERSRSEFRRSSRFQEGDLSIAIYNLTENIRKFNLALRAPSAQCVQNPPQHATPECTLEFQGNQDPSREEAAEARQIIEDFEKGQLLARAFGGYPSGQDKELSLLYQADSKMERISATAIFPEVPVRLFGGSGFLLKGYPPVNLAVISQVDVDSGVGESKESVEKIKANRSFQLEESLDHLKKYYEKELAGGKTSFEHNEVILASYSVPLIQGIFADKTAGPCDILQAMRLRSIWQRHSGSKQRLPIFIYDDKKGELLTLQLKSTEVPEVLKLCALYYKSIGIFSDVKGWLDGFTSDQCLAKIKDLNDIYSLY